MSKTHSAAHHKISTITRSQGRSAVAAAAYRHCARYKDERTGLTHDYRKKNHLVAEGVIGWQGKASELWNAAEAAEKRKNSLVARETVLALPHELDRETQERLVKGFCLYLRDRYGVAASYVIHDPDPAKGGRQNTHAHILWTTRAVDDKGNFGGKVRVLDVRKTGGPEFEHMRSTWAKRANAALEKAGVVERVDHRSLERRAAAGDAPAQEPQEHRGHKRHAVAQRYQREAEAARKTGARTPKPPHFYREELRKKKRNAALRGLWSEARKANSAASGRAKDGRMRDEGDGSEAQAMADTGRLFSAAIETGSAVVRLAQQERKRVAKRRKEREDAAKKAAQKDEKSGAPKPQRAEAEKTAAKAAQRPTTPPQERPAPPAGGLGALLRQGLEMPAIMPQAAPKSQVVKSRPSEPPKPDKQPDNGGRFAALRALKTKAVAGRPQEPKRAEEAESAKAAQQPTTPPQKAPERPQEPQAVKDQTEPTEAPQERPAPHEVRSRTDHATARKATSDAAARIAQALAPQQAKKRKTRGDNTR